MSKKKHKKDQKKELEKRLKKAKKQDSEALERDLQKLDDPGLVVRLQAKGKKQKGADGQLQTAAGASPAPIGTAQQDDPPPITGPGRLMVIMAHPDDAEFTCAGTVAKFAAEGWDVRYLVVTGGDKGTHDPEQYPEKLAAIREEEQRAACRVLGVSACDFLGYPDGFTADDGELRGQIVRHLRVHRPDVVITWDAWRTGFNHRDHRNVGTVVSDAVYPLVRDRLFYQRDEEDGLASHQVNEILLAGAEKPDYTVDITDHWLTKVDAILCHTSQVGGRTREDFLKTREEQVAKDGPSPIEEKFRRWSIRRPARPTPSSDEAAESAAAASAQAEGEGSERDEPSTGERDGSSGSGPGSNGTPLYDDAATSVEAGDSATEPIPPPPHEHPAPDTPLYDESAVTPPDEADATAAAALEASDGAAGDNSREDADSTPLYDEEATAIDEPDSPIAAD